MALKWHIVSFLLVLSSFEGVSSQIDISPKPTAVVIVGEDLTFTCTLNYSSWLSFSYGINDQACFLTFATADPCNAGITSCIILQRHSYSYSCDKIQFNLTISNIQRSMQNTSVVGLLTNTTSQIQTDKVTIQVNVPLTNVTVDPNGMLTLTEGKTRTLTCSAVSFPPATFSWSLEGFSVASSSLQYKNDDTVSSSYNYTARKQDNNKTVTCTARYGSVQYTNGVTLNINYVPKVEIRPSIYDPYQAIENSTNLQLMCSVIDTNPNVTSYRWYKDGSIIPVTTAINTLSTVRRSDSGGFSCDATNIVGPSLMSSAVKLDVLFGITLDILRQQRIISGSRLDVPCTGQCNPPITDDNVRWTKHNNNTFTQNGRRLTITNVNKADKGVYICNVDIMMSPSIGPNVSNSATTPLQVDVLYLPTVQVKPYANNPYKVIENATDLQLTCSVIDSNPGVTSYRWYKDGSRITTITSNYTIPIVRRSDTGGYSCDATNTVGNSSKSTDVKLDVMYGVSIDVTEAQQKEEGELLVLNCTGQSNPSIRSENVLWTKDGNSTFAQTGYQLKINNVDRIDNGSFVCSINISLTPSVGQKIFVSNSASTQVLVYYAPSVNIIPNKRNLTVTENSTNIVLNCNVKDSYPDATNFTWYKNKERLLYTRSIYHISQVKTEDVGMYTCAAKNIVGVSKQSTGVLLNVLYGVRLNISTTQIKVNETEEWSIIGTADGNPPPTFRWIYTHNNTDVQQFTVSSRKNSITIRNANCQDSGLYSVIGHNGIGLDASRSFDVQIICTPREVLNRRLINVFVNDSDLQLEAVFVAYPPPNISWSLKENTTELGSEYNISILESEFPYKTTSFLSKVNNKQLDRGIYHATAVNEHGSQTVTFNIAYKVQDQVSNSPSALIGGISGATGSIFVAVVVMLTFYLIRRRRRYGNTRENLMSTNKNTDEENDKYGLKDNPLYGDGKAVCSVINKNGDNNKRGTKIKSKTNESNREIDDSNLYANSADNGNGEKIRNHGKIKNPYKNKDGLIYADLDFDPSKKEFVIHGLENKTNYALIDLNKIAEPLPSSDEDDVKEMKD